MTKVKEVGLGELEIALVEENKEPMASPKGGKVSIPYKIS